MTGESVESGSSDIIKEQYTEDCWGKKYFAGDILKA